MTQEEEKALRVFETRVRQLILRCQELEKMNARLSEALDSSRQVQDSLQSENELLRRDYANLKLAKMLVISDDDKRDAKARLAKLVRDVDKCIALLNV